MTIVIVHISDRLGLFGYYLRWCYDQSYHISAECEFLYLRMFKLTGWIIICRINRTKIKWNVKPLESSRITEYPLGIFFKYLNFQGQYHVKNWWLEFEIMVLTFIRACHYHFMVHNCALN